MNFLKTAMHHFQASGLVECFGNKCWLKKWFWWNIKNPSLSTAVIPVCNVGNPTDLHEVLSVSAAA